MMYVDGIFYEGVKNNNHHRVWLDWELEVPQGWWSMGGGGE